MRGIVVAYLLASSIVLTEICERPGGFGSSVVVLGSLLEVCSDCEETLSVLSQFIINNYQRKLEPYII